MYVNKSSLKLRIVKNFVGEHGQKWAWPVWLWDSEIDCISRMNRWNELIFACWSKFRKSKSYFNDFWLSMVRIGHSHVVHETLKSAVSKKWVDEFSWFFACWLWGSNFWLDQHHTLYLWFLNASLLQPERFHEIGSVHSSILLSLELDQQVSLSFDMVLENLIKLIRARFFGKMFFTKNGKMSQKQAKDRVFWI